MGGFGLRIFGTSIAIVVFQQAGGVSCGLPWFKAMIVYLRFDILVLVVPNTICRFAEFVSEVAVRHGMVRLKSSSATWHQRTVDFVGRRRIGATGPGGAVDCHSPLLADRQQRWRSLPSSASGTHVRPLTSRKSTSGSCYRSVW